MAKSKSVKHSQELSIQYVEIEKLKRYDKNAKIHTEKQIKKLVSSVKQFGIVNPILVDKDFTVIAGHGRLEAFKMLKFEKVPVVMLEHLTETQVQAYRLADNRIAQDSYYDEALLKSELEEIIIKDEFEISDIGFDIHEIDSIVLEGSYTTKKTKADKTDEIKSLNIEQKVQLGDIWQLGSHLLLCGDSRKTESYKALMNNELADLIVTDPPYNVPIANHVCKTKHKEFEMASGEMSAEEFADFTNSFMCNLVKFSKNGSLHYIFIDWRGVNTFLNVGNSLYKKLQNICVWNKLIGGMGSLYRSQHEFVCVFKNGTEPHTNNVELGKNGRYRTNVWDCRGVNATNPKSLQLLNMHPTVKPVGLLHEILLDASKPNDIVLDCFGGSGSTLLACELAKRRARLIEVSSEYCDLIIHRYQEQFKKNVKFVRNILDNKGDLK